MNSGPRRGVTRGYVGALILAAVIVATALVVSGWGMMALLMQRDPVSSEDVPRWAGPALVVVALAVLAISLWLQALALLRGLRSPAWGRIFVTAMSAYLLWCVLGVLAGMSIDETWISPFAAVLPVIWALCAIAFWAVLARRVYTDRPPPRWPWERAEDTE